MSGNFADYYAGLAGEHQLIARSSREEWTRPRDDNAAGGSPAGGYASKRMFVVNSSHLLATKLENGLRNTILGILPAGFPPRWICMDFVRIGYEEEETENPVVILITAEMNLLPAPEAQEIVDRIQEECHREELFDVEVEMRDGVRYGYRVETPTQDAPEQTEPQRREKDAVPLENPLLAPQEVPLPGSSLATSPDHTDFMSETGTLGAYITVDGTLYALTNHHVVWGGEPGSRTTPFPSEQDAIDCRQILLKQPAEGNLDLQLLATVLQVTLKEKDLRIAHGNKRKKLENDIKSLENEIAELRNWIGDRSNFGVLYKSSGLGRVPESALEGQRHCLDWAIVAPQHAFRYNGAEEFNNELPSYSCANTSHLGYMENARRIGGEHDRSYEDMPQYLNRALTWQEIKNRQAECESIDGNHLVVWKFGRTTNFSYGPCSYIHSNYTSPINGCISDEWMIVDHKTGRNRDCAFSRQGDSGSVVWTSDGFVVGLLWGGIQDSDVTYVTPIQVVLEDIKRACNAKEAKLVVRPEDRNDVVFGKPDIEKKGIRVGKEEENVGFSLLDDEFEGLGI